MSVSAPGPFRVVVIDDHEVVRRGVRTLLEAEDGIEVCGEAGAVAEAIEVAEATAPDVVVMDARLADGSGIEATREIRTRLPRTRVLILTSFADESALFAAIMAGASGYVLKQTKGSDLIQGIRSVAAGHSLLDPVLTTIVLERLRRGSALFFQDEKLARLSPQEDRVLSLVARGKTNGEIGTELHIAEKTVKNYVSSIMSKLEVRRRAEAVAYLADHSPRKDP